MYTKENTYWNKKGQYQSEFDRLTKLMPMMGKSDVVAGEMIRAANRLVYDYYNNGMCNNTSGALEYLYTKRVVNYDVYKTLSPICATEGYTSENLDEHLEQIIDNVVEHILANPDLETKENSEDMFDYQEDSIYPEGEEETCYQCGGEVDYFGDCEECYEECSEEEY